MLTTSETPYENETHSQVEKEFILLNLADNGEDLQRYKDMFDVLARCERKLESMEFELLMMKCQLAKSITQFEASRDIVSKK